MTRIIDSHPRRQMISAATTKKDIAPRPRKMQEMTFRAVGGWYDEYMEPMIARSSGKYDERADTNQRPSWWP